MPILKLIKVAIIPLILVAIAGTAFGQERTPAEAKKYFQESAEAAREVQQGLTFEQFEAQVYKEPSPFGKYIVNGDIPIPNRKLLLEFFNQKVKNRPEENSSVNPEVSKSEFTIYHVGGLDIVWNNTVRRQLTYCVSSRFANHLTAVAAAMDSATAAWEAVADVDFTYLPAEDTRCDANNPSVLFDVSPVDANGQYLARAFFPNENRINRNVLIDSSSFALDPNGKLQLVGILRHELGHTLGARHEHTRPESGACFEDADWRGVTDYDAFSVMHYPQCNGRGDWSLQLTESDKKGIACIYGPAPGLAFAMSDCGTLPSENIKLSEYANQTVNKNELKDYPALDLVPGSRFTATMIGEGASSGDPDLYVKFDAPVTISSYDCRPYNDGPEETCDVDVPINKHKASIMVRGYAAAHYKLTIRHIAP